jgi:ABC-type multidrug transport system fused ATPase/permease subunit
LPDGDQTEIGERGINLSGGQKARVAIARAIYRSNYDVLILDDPLSAVDPHVAHAIFDQCVMGMAAGKTRLLVLNSHYDLLSRADKILVMEHGVIAGEGKYEDIIARFPDLALQTAAVGKSHEHEDDNASDGAKDGGKLEQLMDGSSGITQASDASKTPRYEVKTAEHDVDSKDNDGEAGRLVQAEDRVKGTVGSKVYKAYFDESGVNGIVVALVLIASYGVSQAARVVADWWPGHWARNMVRYGIDPAYSGTAFGMWYLGIIALCAVLTFGRAFLMIETCMQTSKRLHDDLFRRVLQAPVNNYFDITPVGRILNRFSNDLDQMDSILPQEYQLLGQNLSMALGSLVVSAFASYWIGVSYIPVLIVFVVVGQYFKKTSRELKRLEGITRTPVYNLFGETLSGLPTIRAFKMQEAFKRLNKKVVDENANLFLTYWCASRWLATRLDLLSVVIIFVVTLYLVATKGDVGSLTSGISLTYALMLTSVIQWVMRSVDRTDNAMTSVERLMHFRGIAQEDDNGALASEVIPGSSWPSQGSVRFSSLCLRYRAELPLVLRGVDMEIGAGEKVGICGRTGAGKSSLMVALFRICEFDSGTIFVDGVDIMGVTLRELRRNLAIIPQDPVMFSGSLRENLDPFGEYSDAAIWAVLQQVHMADSLTKWGAGLDFEVAEQGDNLSVGQRQLLCIGRALLKDSKIVVLDEATANVDTATDNLIQVTIKDTFVSKTVLIIAHRINTIMHCDKIAVMDAGRVAEFGSPDNLLKTPESNFASLATRSGHRHAGE